MSTDRTPIDRAKEALSPSESRATKRTEYGEMSTPILLLSAENAARAAVSAALHDPNLASVLAAHQVESRGLTFGSPDRCTCQVEVLAAPYLLDDTDHHEDVLSRRGRSFAAHQADAVRAAILGGAS